MSTRTSILWLALMVTIPCALGESQVYVVHMDPTKAGALDHSLGGSKRWFDSVMETLTQLEAEEEEEITETAQLLYAYETTLTGFSAKLTPKQVELLETLDGFLHASPDELLTLHTTHSPQFLGLHPFVGLWSSPSLASDVIVGVIDTGIWPDHVSFQDTGLGPVPSRWRGKCEQGTKFFTSNCNKKLIGARAFFKGYEEAAGRINETLDYRSARDSLGHGTHTASTAAGAIVPGASMLGAAEGFAGGISYAARVAAYKVCWRAGCANSDILAAMDQAVADGVDVLSLSLGGGSRPYYADNMAIAAFGAVQKGVFVSCSAGNSGPSASTVSNTAPWLMTVAASYLDRSFPTTIQLGDGRTFKGASLYSGKPTGKLQLVYGHSAGGEGAEYCLKGSLSPKLVKGKMVVCDRGINDRVQKGEQVKLAGGAAMLLLNSDAHGEELITDPHILPASSLGAVSGKAIRDYVATKKRPAARIIFEGTQYGQTAPTMAAFSSRGPSQISPEVLKPDVTAPGVNILAAWPRRVSPTQLSTDKRRVSFNILSGTSMSCPHVSGLAALLRSVHRDWSPAAIKSALMTTAYTDNNRNVPMSDAGSGSDQVATPFAFGSGHVNPERAVDPGLIYDIATEDYLNYFCTLNYTSAQIAILAKRWYDCPKSQKLQAGGDLNYPSFALIFRDATGNSSERTYTRTVTNVGDPGKYSVRVWPPAGVSVRVEPSVLSFKRIGEKKSYHVRFVALSRGGVGSSSSFGELVWESGALSVRSPIVVMWQ